MLRVEVTAGNVHDSVAFDPLYDKLAARFAEIQFAAMDAAYKTPWIARRLIEDGRIPILPYTGYRGNKNQYKSWEYSYDPQSEPTEQIPKHCVHCPHQHLCGANEKGQKIFLRHIWQEHPDLAEQLRKTKRGKKIYAMRKETIERVFGDAKEKHAMCYTTYRGLARVTNGVRLKFAAMNLKKPAMWTCKTSASVHIPTLFAAFSTRTAVFVD